MSLLQYAPILVKTRLTQVFTVSRALLKKEITYYPEYLEKFERRYADYMGAGYALTFCNGTSAIEAAIFAAGVRPGDEVLVPSCTFHASIDPIINSGAIPVFVDVDKNTFTLCLTDVAKKINEKTKAIVVVHLFGIPVDVPKLKVIIGNRDIKIIEDASHVHGGRVGDVMCGALGDIGAFSLQGYKAVAAGEGGIVVTDNEESFIKMSMWGHFDRHGNEFSKIGAQDFSSVGIGYKRRMAPISALVADADLRYLDVTNSIMNKTAELLDLELGSIDGVEVAKLCDGAIRGGFFGGYPLVVSKAGVSANDVIEKMQKLGLEAQGYPFALHHNFRIYTDLNYRHRVLNGLMENDEVEQKLIKLPATENLKSKMVLIPRKYLVLMNKKLLNRIKSVLVAL